LAFHTCLFPRFPVLQFGATFSSSAFSSPARRCRVFRFRVFQSCSFDCAMFSGLAFSVHPICCGQMAAWIKMSLGMELGLCPGDFVLDGDPVALSPKRGRTPKFSAHVYCDQTAGWMKLVLDMMVGLNLGAFVLQRQRQSVPHTW